MTDIILWLAILSFTFSLVSLSLFIFLVWLTTHDEKQALKIIQEAYQESKRFEARSISTPGGLTRD